MQISIGDSKISGSNDIISSQLLPTFGSSLQNQRFGPNATTNAKHLSTACAEAKGPGMPQAYSTYPARSSPPGDRDYNIGNTTTTTKQGAALAGGSNRRGDHQHQHNNGQGQGQGEISRSRQQSRDEYIGWRIPHMYEVADPAEQGAGLPFKLAMGKRSLVHNTTATEFWGQKRAKGQELCASLQTANPFSQSESPVSRRNNYLNPKPCYMEKCSGLPFVKYSAGFTDWEREGMIRVTKCTPRDSILHNMSDVRFKSEDEQVDTCLGGGGDEISISCSLNLDSNALHHMEGVRSSFEGSLEEVAGSIANSIKELRNPSCVSSGHEEHFGAIDDAGGDQTWQKDINWGLSSSLQKAQLLEAQMQQHHDLPHVKQGMARSSYLQQQIVMQKSKIVNQFQKSLLSDIIPEGPPAGRWHHEESTLPKTSYLGMVHGREHVSLGAECSEQLASMQAAHDNLEHDIFLGNRVFKRSSKGGPRRPNIIKGQWTLEEDR